MRYYKIIFSICLIFSVTRTFSQNDSVTARITVTDQMTYKGLQGVSVINRKSGDIFVTDINGLAIAKIHKQDPLYLFLSGYHALQFSLADSAPKRVYVLHLAIEPFSTGLDKDVIIRSPKTLDKIAEDPKLGITPPELIIPKVNPFYSPMDALYNAVNKRTVEKKTLRKEVAANDRRKVFKELLNYYNDKKLIDLPEENYDDFIDFCNLPDTYLKTHSDYELMTRITAFYKQYAERKGLVK